MAENETEILAMSSSGLQSAMLQEFEIMEDWLDRARKRVEGDWGSLLDQSGRLW
jgi:hypothetical protein